MARRSAVPSLLDRLPPGWTVIHDVVSPGRQAVTVDHVVVGPPGVFVVRAVRVTGGSRVTGAARGVEAAAVSVAGLVPFVPRHRVHPVLCLAGPGPVRASAGLAEAVDTPAPSTLVVSQADLTLALLTRPAVLSPDQALALGAVLRAEAGSATTGVDRGAGGRTVAARAPRRTTVGGRAPLGAVVVGAGVALAAGAALLVGPQLAGGTTAVGPDRVDSDVGSTDVEVTPADGPTDLADATSGSAGGSVGGSVGGSAAPSAPDFVALLSREPEPSEWIASRCVEDAGAGISMVLALNGRDGHVALRDGSCTAGQEVARVVERAGGFVVRGERALARPVARMLEAASTSSG